MKRHLLISAIILLSLFFACKRDSDTQSQRNTAVVTFALGNSFRFQAGTWDRVDVGATLNENDRIKTDPGSMLDIQIGGSVVRVKEKSDLVLSRLARDGSTGLEQNTLELRVGRVLASPRKLARGEVFVVRTPTAVAGVRGTKFMVIADPSRDTRVSVIEGSVRVSKRIQALETAADTGKGAEVIQQVQQKVEQEAVVVTEDKSCLVKAAAVEKTNSEVEKVVASLASTAGTEAPKAVVEEKVQQAIQAVTAAPPITVTAIAETDSAVREEFKEIRAVEERGIREIQEKKDTKSEVRIQASPETAQIYLNGELVGAGTVTLSLVPGTYSVRATAAGHEESAKQIQVVEGAKLAEAFALAPLRPLSRTRWNRNVGAISSEIAYSGSAVFVATSKGEVVAMNRENARTLWTSSVAAAVSSGISVDGDLLHVATADERLHQLRAEDGKIVWSKKFDGALINGMKPVVAGGTIYLATSKGSVYSLNRSGTERWHATLPAAVLETPILRSGSLYLSANDGKLYSLDAGRGTTRWLADMGQRFKAVFAGNDIYAVNFQGRVSAIDADRGTVKWSRDLDDRFIARPVVIGGRIYLGSLSGALFALDVNGGNTVFRRSLGGSIRTDIAVGEGTLYVASRRTLYSVGMNGAVQWTHDTGSPIVTSAGAAGSDIFVGLENGKIVSVNKELKR